MISGYLSNAHAKLGYTARDDAPTLPLRIVPGRNEWGGHTHRVVDAEDAWMADFRNPTDAKRFVAAYGVAPARAPERVKVGELILPGINGDEYDPPDTILRGAIMEQLQERLVRGGKDRVLDLFVEVPAGVQPSDGGQSK